MSDMPATSQVKKRSAVALTDNYVLVGNPNVGKSVIFGILTGKYVNVSNYPGTTVEITKGDGKLDHKLVTFTDTPGTNSLIPMSEDERVTRDILLNEEVKAILQVGDGKNLKRVLFLSLQIAELGIPFVLNLNMMDETIQRGISVKLDKLNELLNVEVNSTIAIRRSGTDKLEEKLLQAKKSDYKIKYPAQIEKAIAQVEKMINFTSISNRALAVMLLAGEESMRRWAKKNLSSGALERLDDLILNLENNYSTQLNFIITQARYREVDKIYNQVVEKKIDKKNKVLSWLDNNITHPVWGIPFLALVLFIVYEFVGVFGAGTAVDFFENTIFGEYINPAAVWLFDQIPIPFVQELFVGQYGIITMALSYGFAIVLPIVATFFIVFSILEDTGYLPRLALFLNKFFKSIGLNGKAVLPMVLGLGCDTMATMAARILETRKERIIVILLLALGVPCSAQLGVILGMTALLPWQASVIWLGVVTLVMVTVGYLSSRILPGEKSDFILELPPIRMPVFSNIIIKTMARIEWYLKEVIPIFILGTLILFIMNKTDVLLWLEKLSAPVVQTFLGLPGKTTEAFLIGFLRRDYGAAGLFNLANQGLLNNNQIVVSVITITLFVPCIANFLMIIKELGLKIALAMSFFIVPFAFVVGGLVNLIFNLTGINL